MSQPDITKFLVPDWVNQQHPRGQITLLGVKCNVSLDAAERIGERIAILTTDGGCDEETAQRAALNYLNRKRRTSVTTQGRSRPGG